MKIKFLTPVQHDAQTYQTGEIADLHDKAAKSLVDCGAAEKFDPAAEKFDPAAEKLAAKAEAEAEAAKAEAEAEAASKDAEAGKLV